MTESTVDSPIPHGTEIVSGKGSHLLHAALAHAARGRPVFPCGADKRPLTPNGFKDASCDPQRIAQWWQRWPDALIGMPTGGLSGVWVLDIDQHGYDGEESLRDLRDGRPMPDTVEATTPTGGRHLYFRMPAGETIRNSAGKLGRGLDVRGEGGYVILPPSYINGNAYEWDAICDPDEGAKAIEAPDWLLDRVKSRVDQYRPQQADGKVGAGGRNDWLFRLGCALRQKGLTEQGIAAALQAENSARCVPPIADDEVWLIARSAGRYSPQEVPEDEAEEEFPPDRIAEAITAEELASARLTPDCIVDGYLYADVGQVVAPGGMGKTTLLLHESICIAIGRRVWGMEVCKRGWTLFLSKEDMRERLVARIREIMAGMRLSESERAIVMRDLFVIDVTGSNRRLIFANGNNIDRTALAGQICEKYRGDPPVQMIVDPAVSFGASESMVNDNEQGLIEVGRFVVRELGCCYRYVHHTGKSNARERTTDQYSGRGGSAFADGSRMTTVLTRWDRDGNEPLPNGLIAKEGCSIAKLTRAKLTYAPPDLPTIWIRRQDYEFDSFVEFSHSLEQVQDSRMLQLERFLAERLKTGEYHTARSLRDQHAILRMPRRDVEACISRLIAQGRVREDDLPEELRHGARRKYLKPIGPVEE